MLGPQDVESAWGWVSKGFSFPYSSIPACDPTAAIIELILSRCVRHDEPSVPKELKESDLSLSEHLFSRAVAAA